MDVGRALMAIRDARLYRDEYGTFEDYCRQRWGFVASRARQLIAAAEVVSNLESVTTVTPSTESQARPLAALEPEAQREAWAEAVATAPKNEDGEPVITARHVTETVERRNVHVANNSGENEWYTPPKFLEAAREVMGAIDLDPASCELANGNVQAAQFFSAEENGLEQQWGGNVWMNPPYAQPLIQQFCDKLLHEVYAGNVASACVLVNNGTETAWGQALLREASAVCFPSSRIRFIDKEGKPSGAPLQGQMIVYMGADVSAFQQAFAKFGVVLLG